MFAVSLALLANAFRGRDRGTAFGIWGATTAAGGLGASDAVNSGDDSCGPPKSPIPSMAGACAAGALRGAISGVTGVGLILFIGGAFVSGSIYGSAG